MICRMRFTLLFLAYLLFIPAGLVHALDNTKAAGADATDTTAVETDKPKSQSVNAQAATKEECKSDDCEKPAPYVLRIIKSGEGKPRSTNKTDEGKQDNRRVDVTLTRKVPVAAVKKETRRALFGSGGAVWISKDPTSLDRILDIKAAASVSLVENKPESAVSFEVQNNYAHYIDKLDVLIWGPDASQLTEPLVTQSLKSTYGSQKWDWEVALPDIELEPGLVVQYALRATDSQGRTDQTKRQNLRFVQADEDDRVNATVPEISVLEEVENTDGQYAELDRESIQIKGSKVRLLGQDLRPSSKVTINDHEVDVDKDGRFGVEYLLPEGEHSFDVSIEDDEDQRLRKKLNIDLDSDYFFMVGLADVTAGKNKVSGSIEPLAVDKHHYGGDIFVDGRLAFYLKGRVRGKYLITAQMDTGTEDIGELFDDFHRKDAQSVFRRLDPDQYYPVYGDNSTLVDDTDSQGKLYVRVDWDRSRLIWGNYNTNFTGTEFAPFNRSLYGAQLLHKSTNDTSLGDAKHSLNVFASKAQSLFRHNEFLGTGGSLYYLRDTDIVAGSEKVWVEVRQSGTNRVAQKVALVAGRDYDIDDFQGRLILRRPLLSVAAQGGPSIIRDEPLAGNQTFLIVDYEYSPTNLDFGDASAGVRAKKWLGNHVGIGGTWAHEQRAGDDYDIKGADVTIKRSDQTFIKGEFAQSESSQTSGSYISNDGGLSFDPFVSNTAQTKGNAIGIEARASLTDFKPQSRQLEVGLWTKRQEAGFSTANTDVGVDTTDMGIEAVARPSDKFALFARATRLNRKSETTETNGSVQLDYIHSDRITVSGELRNSREQNHVANTNGESTLVAGKLSVDMTDQLNVYGMQQYTIKKSGTETRNNSATLGANYIANSKISLTGEVSAGDRGNSALLGTEVNLSDTYSVYTNYTYSFSREKIEKNTFVLGQRKTLSSQLKVYSEHQFSDEDSRDGYAHTVGLDQQFTKFTSASLSAQRASVDNGDGTNTERNTVSAGLAYQKENTRFNSKLEYRWDEAVGIDTRQWVSTNRFEYRKTPSFRWQGKLNASITDDQLGDDDARFVEAGIGFALRPVANDRLNMLGRLTYLNDLQPRSQSVDADQRSLIASMEGLYDITRRWSAGAKFAHRSSEIRLERNTGAWIDNDASLISARARYKAPFGVDASVAYHWLGSKATKGDKHGALFTIGRRVGDNLTFSVGYNFTSFDDNLANDSYDVKGWFINLIGAY